MKNCMAVPQKITNRTPIWSSKPTSGHMFKENKIRILERYLPSRICDNLLHNSPDMGTAQVSADRS